MPRLPTEARLTRVALAYLERFAASTEMLRRVLNRRVRRAVEAGLIQPEPGRALVEAVVAKAMRSGLVEDRGFAEMRAGSLFRRGGSPRRIAEDLAAKGIDRDVIEATLEGLRRDSADPALEAAVALARRRRLGPWRSGDRDTFYDRDMAVLARAGFGFDVARKVLDAEDPETLAALVTGE